MNVLHKKGSPTFQQPGNVKQDFSTYLRMQMVPEKPPITVQNILTQFRRCGRGILKGAAFRQRPLSRLLINVLAGTRTLPPEGSEPKASGNLMVKQKTTFLSMQIRQHFAPASWGKPGLWEISLCPEITWFLRPR